LSKYLLRERGIHAALPVPPPCAVGGQHLRRVPHDGVAWL
jgi:hypothetical protein